MPSHREGRAMSSNASEIAKKSRGYHLHVIAVLALCCAAVYYVGSVRRQTSLIDYPLAVNPDQLNFGEVWEDKAFRLLIKFTNVSNSTIEVADVMASCSCADLKPRKFSLLPAVSIDLAALLDLTRDRDRNRISGSRKFSVDFFPLVKRPPL